MLAVVFRRHLRERVSYEEYVDAWRAETGYGVRLEGLTADAAWLGAFRLRDEHDFEKDPTEVPIGSRASIFPA